MTALSGSFRRKTPYLLLSLFVLGLDQWSKWWVEKNVDRFGSIEVIEGFLNIIHVRNSGVAFGLFATHGDAVGTAILAAVGLFALGFVTYYFYLTPLWDRLLLLSLGLILGGAVGNLLDRVLQGEVTDFIDAYYGTYHWHTFNVADSAISVGVALMLISAFRTPTPPEAAAPAARDSEASRDSETPPSAQPDSRDG